MLYLKNELSAAERTEMETHIENCSKCNAEMEQLRQMDRILHTSIKTEPAPDLNADVFVSAQSRNYWKYAVAVAATIIIFVSIFTLNKDWPEQISCLQWDDKGLYELIELHERIECISANSATYCYDSHSEFDVPQNTIGAILELEDNVSELRCKYK